MKDKAIILLAVSFLSLSSCAAAVAPSSSTGAGSVSAIVNIYSGRSSPQWNLSSDEIATLRERLMDLPAAAEVKTPAWDHVYVKNSDPSSGLSFAKLYLFKKTVVSVDNFGEKKYYRDVKDAYGWLIGRGDANDQNYVPPKRASLPANVPAIGVVPSKIVLDSGGVSERSAFLTIFNEGNGVLEGTVVGTSSVKIGTSSFSLPAGKGVDVPLSISATGGEPEIYVEIRSNDPSLRAVKIPIAYSSTGAKTGADPGPSGPAFDASSYLPYVAVLLLIFLGASYFLRRRKSKKNSIEDHAILDAWCSRQEGAKKKAD